LGVLDVKELSQVEKRVFWNVFVWCSRRAMKQVQAERLNFQSLIAAVYRMMSSISVLQLLRRLLISRLKIVGSTIESTRSTVSVVPQCIGIHMQQEVCWLSNGSVGISICMNQETMFRDIAWRHCLDIFLGLEGCHDCHVF
jgi:hypothetical protein